jgi:hypothetical protein
VAQQIVDAAFRVHTVAPVHQKQLLTYLKLADISRQVAKNAKKERQKESVLSAKRGTLAVSCPTGPLLRGAVSEKA